MSHYGMDIAYRQLHNHLKSNALDLYWLSSDEVFLLYDTQQRISASLQHKGFIPHRLTLNTSSDWSVLEHTLTTGCLFDTTRCLLVDATQIKLNAKFAQHWLALCQKRQPSLCLCLSTARVSAAQKKTQWFSNMQQAHGCMYIWPLNSSEFHHWLQARLAHFHLKLTSEAFSTFQSLSQSDPKVSSDMIEKLALIYGEHATLDPTDILKAYSNTTPISTFDICNAALNGHSKDCLRHLAALNNTPHIPIALWGLLNNTLKRLITAKMLIDSGKTAHTVIRQVTRNAQEQERFASTLRRLNIQTLEHIQQHLWTLELSIKGLNSLDPWHIIHQILLQLSTTRSHHV